MEIVRAGEAAGRAPTDPAKARKILDAAHQFEALLIEQLLRGMRGSGEGWLSDGGDGAGSIATEFAEQQLAGTFSAQGGLGLASLIVSGLDRGK